jgi:hypothetical protein
LAENENKTALHSKKNENKTALHSKKKRKENKTAQKHASQGNHFWKQDIVLSLLFTKKSRIYFSSHH